MNFDYKLFIDVPPGVRVENLSMAYDPLYNGDRFIPVDDPESNLSVQCDSGEPILCNISHHHLPHSLRISYDVTAISEGKHEIKWKIQGEALPGRPDEHSHITHVSYLPTTAVLQEMIDVADEGEYVELPSGRYLGTVNGGGRTLNVSGSRGDEPTILTSLNASKPILTGLGEGSVYSNFELQSSGAYIVTGSEENITLRDSTITPVPELEYNYAMGNLINSSSYRFVNNRVLDWWSSDRCESLFYFGALYAEPVNVTRSYVSGYGTSWTFDHGGETPYASNLYHSRVYIQDSVFSGGCNQLFRLEGDDFSLDSELFIMNNTIHGHGTLISVHAERDANVHFKNNIVYNAGRVLDFDDGQFQDFAAELTISRNLVWRGRRPNNTETVLRDGQSDFSGVVEEIEGLYADPLFRDVNARDYAISALSPAIDAGVEPDTYRWTIPYSDETADPTQNTKYRVPVDGLMDGTESYDIGAVEFQP